MEILIPILVLVAVCAVAAVGYRVITGSTRDSGDAGLPKAEPDGARPLGDTAEAHDEINPHDLPKDNPGRPAAEEMVEDQEDTTTGAASADEAHRGARP